MLTKTRSLAKPTSSARKIQKYNVTDEVNKRYLKSLNKDGISSVSLLDNYAYPIEGTTDIGIANTQAAIPQEADDVAKAIPFTITILRKDRDGDIVMPMGCQLHNYKDNPVVFFGHQSFQVPIAKAKDPLGRLTVWPMKDRVKAIPYFDEHDSDAMFIYGKILRGYLSATSIAFVPIDAVQMEQEQQKAHPEPGTLVMAPGWIFKVWDLTEFSIVGIPSNAGAIRDSLDSEKSFITPKLQKAYGVYAAKAKGRCFTGWCPCPPCEEKMVKTEKVVKASYFDTDSILRWNKSLSKAFEIDDKDIQPANTSYDWAKQYLACEIKNIHEDSFSIPSARMGSFLTGLKHALGTYFLNETRNVHGEYKKGSESPPVYETIQLNSEKRASFLVEGTQFWQDSASNSKNKRVQVQKSSLSASTRKFILRFSPSWGGLNITSLVENKNAPLITEIVDSARAWAKQNNFMKGEAFALSGEFLPRTTETWEDIFLEPKNIKTLSRVLNLFNEKGNKFANRGIVFCGPPGTGKSLSGRVYRNQAKGTFIWVSARDFHKSGSFGGFSLAFEMARELAPSILFLEDIDNWMDNYTVDLLKTEMDGISRSKGVLTILTTNFPERLPAALIDRPGRFHDVLNFDLPKDGAKKLMLKRWLPDLPESAIDSAIPKTVGYSGAHVYELAQFARTLNEHDGIAAVQALEEALQKIEEQKELINEVQLSGSNYNARRRSTEVPTMKTKKALTNKKPNHSCGGCNKKNPCGKCQKKIEDVVTKASGDCVTHKIPKLVDEGYDKDQSAAIAYSMCGENKGLEADDIRGHEEHAKKFGIDRSMNESSGTDGGYTQAGDNQVRKKDEDMEDEEEEKEMEDEETPDEGEGNTEEKDEGEEGGEEEGGDDVEEKDESDAGNEEEEGDQGENEDSEETDEDESVDDNEDSNDDEEEDRNKKMVEKDENGEMIAPHSAKLLAKLGAHFQSASDYITAELPKMDNKNIKTWLEGKFQKMIEDLTGEISKLFDSEHPDHEMKSLIDTGEEEAEDQASDMEDRETASEEEAGDDEPDFTEGEDENSEEMNDEEETKNAVDEYKNPPKSWKTGKLKRSHFETVRDAGQHMHDLCSAADIPKYHKDGLKFHSFHLGELCRELSKTPNVDECKRQEKPKKKTPPKVEENLDKSIADEIAKLSKKCGKVGDRLFGLTGVKVET